MLVVYLYEDIDAPASPTLMTVSYGESWCYFHGHARRHESVWFVPGTVEG